MAQAEQPDWDLGLGASGAGVLSLVGVLRREKTGLQEEVGLELGGMGEDREARWFPSSDCLSPHPLHVGAASLCR